MTPQNDCLNLISLNHTISRSDCFPDNYFGDCNIEEDCSAIYQIYPRIICVYKTCKIKKNVSSNLMISAFNTHVCLQDNLTNASRYNPYNIGQMRFNFGYGRQV